MSIKFVVNYERGADNKRSPFETAIAGKLKESDEVSEFGYEVSKLVYTIEAKYIPDFTVTTTEGEIIYIEAKGHFTSKDRKKLLTIKKLYPKLDIRLVFQKDNWVTTKKKQRYSDWAAKHGFPHSVWPQLPL